MAQKLQFGGYVFAHNPRRIEIGQVQNLAAYVLPFYGTVTQNLGAQCRTVHCEGEVFSQDAAQTADAAAEIRALSGRVETLCLPTGERFSAVVSRFSCAEEGDGRVLACELDFVETDTNEEADG